MKEIKDKQAVAKLLNQDIHIKGGGVMNLKSLAPKVEKIVDKDPSDDVEEFPYEYVKLPDIECVTTSTTRELFDIILPKLDSNRQYVVLAQSSVDNSEYENVINLVGFISLQYASLLGHKNSTILHVAKGYNGSYHYLQLETSVQGQPAPIGTSFKLKNVRIMIL